MLIRYKSVMNRTMLVVITGLALLTIPAFTSAQQPLSSLNPQGLTMERGELESLLESLEGMATSPAYSNRMREGAQRDAGVIRARLNDGDFRVGDQITLVVDGEPGLTGEYPVEGGPRISLPTLGTISLAGVLRSELESHMTKELGRFLQNPVVRAVPRVRVSVQGAVGSPGFFTVPADMLLSELLMHAGGPGGSANLEQLRIERVGQRLWEGDELRVMLADGRTLDQLNVRGGDELIVPQRSTSNIWGSVARWGVAVATSVAFGVRFFF
jgi:hypothetical protein